MKLEFEDVVELSKIHRNGSHWRILLSGTTAKLVPGSMGFRIMDARDRLVEAGNDTLELTPEEQISILTRTDIDVVIKSELETNPKTNRRG